MFRTEGVDLYCSILTKKELLSKGGLKDSERKRIIKLLSMIKVLKIDDDINNKFFFFFVLRTPCLRLPAGRQGRQANSSL